MSKSSNSTLLDTVKPFINGGAAGMLATSVIQPIDLIKVRIQLLGEGGSAITTKNPISLAAQIIKKEGFFSLYKGLSAALLRQATYTTARMGLHKNFSNMMKEEGKDLSFAKKSIASLAAGGIGSIVGTPADLALIRMQADNTLPPDQRRGYKNVLDALIKVTKEEGFFGMFKGTSPIVVRAMALNLGMLATYDQTVDIMKNYTESDFVVLTTAKVLSGFFASSFSLPFDFIKTRIQKMKKDPVTGKYPYKGIMDCALKVQKTEGLGAFYRGFWTYYIRIAPHAMLTLWFLEIFKKYW